MVSPGNLVQQAALGVDTDISSVYPGISGLYPGCWACGMAQGVRGNVLVHRLVAQLALTASGGPFACRGSDPPEQGGTGYRNPRVAPKREILKMRVSELEK